MFWSTAIRGLLLLRIILIQSAKNPQAISGSSTCGAVLDRAYEAVGVAYTLAS
jgi:hypothetical protein